MAITQWACEPEQRLDIPEPLARTMRWRFSVEVGNQRVNGECAEFIVSGSWVQLKDCLCDSSDRFNGQLMKRRATWRGEISGIGVKVLLLEKHPGEPLSW